MKAETFCEHFAAFADAPNGIEKLRDLIRTLAVRGKLVASDRNDEPAVDIVEKIQAEKRKLIATGEVKSDKKTWVSSLVKPPYDIPASWCWVRLQDVFEISRGGSPRPAGDPRFFGGSIPWITVGEVTKDSGKYLTGTTGGLTEEGSSRSRFINPGDLLLTNSGATLGVPKISKIRGCMNDGVAVLRQFHQVDLNEFAYLYLTQQTSAFRSVNQGMGQPNLNTPIIAGWFFPFPPLAEQRRIVEKVDQLLGLCDELAARLAAQREKRQRLVGATLDRLVSTRNPAEFPTHAHRLRNHFDQLFDTPTPIPQLRQTILQLAVQGQLVPQDPDDEPAEELRLRVLGSLRDTIDGDQRRRIEKLSDVTPNAGPFDLPPGWTWARFPELGRFGRGKSRHRPRNEPKLYTDGIYPLVQTGDVARANGWIKTHTGKYNEFGLEQSRLWPVGTMCITIAANIADSGRLSFEACIPDSVVGFIPAAEIQDASYFEFFMRTAKARLEDYAPSTAQKNINLGILDAVLIPFPPLAEQKRIVTKVTELLSLCDALEAKLTQAETASTQLLSAAVHQLLNDPVRCVEQTVK